MSDAHTVEEAGRTMRPASSHREEHSMDRRISPWWVAVAVVVALAAVVIGVHNIRAHQANAETRIERSYP